MAKEINYCICESCSRRIDEDELYCDFHKEHGCCNNESEGKKEESRIWRVTPGVAGQTGIGGIVAAALKGSKK